MFIHQLDMSQQDEADRLVKLAKSMITQDDIFHRGFLKPIEIALKTYKTQFISGETNLTPSSLPAGLKIAVNSSAESQRRVLVNIEQINEKNQFFHLREKNQDNMLALMKKKKGIQLCICVCMYSQTKPMLKSTLAGVAENIANLVAYEGLDPDDIAVVVMMDGIEKVDKSIIGYFQELERSSNINLGENIVPSLTVEQLRERAHHMTEEEINDEEMKNVNNFLFDPAELDERNGVRFEAMHSEYHSIKALSNSLKKINTKKALWQDLPAKAQQYFLEEAKKKRMKDFNQTAEQVNILKDSVILERYVNDINQARPLVAKAIQRANQFCSSYMSNKEDLSYLAFFRRKVYFDFTTLTKSRYLGQKHPESMEELIEQDESFVRPYTNMNLFLCTKYQNAGKLSSHNWFFNGFCQELKPKFAVLLDVGLRTQGTALMKMYKYMKGHPNIGGVCGYMSLKMEKLEAEDEVKSEHMDFISSVMTQFVDIQRTQQVEYHFAHLMDKPFEAAFGFIHVLPGAFSAYNMNAIVKYDEPEDDVLLKSYFKSIRQKLADRKVISSKLKASNVILRTLLPDAINSCCISVDEESDQTMLYNENVYLAEDRILCMGIHKKGFDMAFLPDAYAEVDPMKTVHGLLGQRKRWINGSYFAFEKVKKQLSAHEKENGCEFGLNLQIFYLSFMNALSYFAPAFFMFTVHIAMGAFRIDVLERYVGNTIGAEVLDFFVFTMDFIYVMMIAGIIFYSLHFKAGSKYFIPLIYTVSTIFGIFMLIIMGVLAVDIIRGLIDNSSYLTNNIPPGQTANVDQNLINLLRYLLIGSLAIYFVPLLLYWCFFCKIQPLCEVILGYFSFLFYTPTYLNILNIYSLCKIDDISWGTKGLDATSSSSSGLADQWKLIKIIHVMKYLIWNIILAAVLMTLGETYQTKFWVTFGMVCLIGLSLGVKVFIGVLYFMIYKCRSYTASSQPSVKTSSRIDRLVKSYEPAIMQEVGRNLNNIKNEYIKNKSTGFSFIQASRTMDIMKAALRNQSKVQDKRSNVVNRNQQLGAPKRNNPTLNPILSPIPSDQISPLGSGQPMNKEMMNNRNDRNKFRNAQPLKR